MVATSWVVGRRWGGMGLSRPRGHILASVQRLPFTSEHCEPAGAAADASFQNGSACPSILSEHVEFKPCNSRVILSFFFYQRRMMP